MPAQVFPVQSRVAAALDRFSLENLVSIEAIEKAAALVGASIIRRPYTLDEADKKIEWLVGVKIDYDGEPIIILFPEDDEHDVTVFASRAVLDMDREFHVGELANVLQDAVKATAAEIRAVLA